MSIHRRAVSRDKNEPEMVEFFERCGYMVTPLSGEGVPDLLLIRPSVDNPVYVCHTLEQAQDIADMRHDIALVEVKGADPRLTPGQVEWHSQALNRPDLKFDKSVKQRKGKK